MSIFHFFLFLIFVTQANEKLVEFSNYFNKIAQGVGQVFYIYAGATGNYCTGNGTSPCNSCNSSIQLNNPNLLTTGLVCNQKQVYPSLEFSVTLTSSNPSTYINGCSYLIIGLNGNNVVFPNSISSYVPNQANQSVTAKWTWGNLCQEFSGQNTCTTSFNKTLRVGFNNGCNNTNVSANYVDFIIRFRYVTNSPFMTFGCPSSMGSFESFCEYTVFPGDKKLYIINQGANLTNSLNTGLHNSPTPAHATTADPSGIKYDSIRVFYAKGGFNNITLGSSYIDIEMDEEKGLSDNRIQNLENDTQYSVIIANKDEAGTIELFSHPQNPNNHIAMSDSTTPIGQTQSSTPEPVSGLLDNERCFIATAAFGNSSDPQVLILRKFRDQFLLKFSWGQKFVKWYYQHSPKIANQIAQNKYWRKIIRAFLWPITFILKPVYGQDWPEAEEFKKAQQEIHSGKKKITHPLEAKGLRQINPDGSYNYTTNQKIRTYSLSLAMEFVPFLSITSSGSIKTHYDTARLSYFAIGYELVPLESLKKQLSFKITVGFGQHSGKGYLAKALFPSEEIYNLFILPMGIRPIFKLDLFDTQILVPFISGGIGYLGLIEMRDDGTKTNIVGTPLIESSMGIQLSFRRINPQIGLSLNRDYQIQDLWIYFEARHVNSLKNSFVLNGTEYASGLILDF